MPVPCPLKIFDSQFHITQDEVRLLFSEEMLTGMKETISKEFGRLLSEVRKTMINECLDYRYFSHRGCRAFRS